MNWRTTKTVKTTKTEKNADGSVTTTITETVSEGNEPPEDGAFKRFNDKWYRETFGRRWWRPE